MAGQSTLVPRRLALLATVSVAISLAVPLASQANTDPNTARIAGPTAIATAVELARRAFPQGATTALLAHVDAASDALVAAGLAGAVAGPILLVTADGVPNATWSALGALGVRRVVVLGGAGASGSAVAAAVTGAGYDVESIAGGDRYATAAATAMAIQRRTGGVRRVYVASGETVADGLAAGGLAYAQRAPILLTRGSALPDATAIALRDLAPAEVTVLGGPGAISDSVIAEIALRVPNVRRLGGANRGATAALLADLAPSTGRVVLARGDTLTDALAAGPLAGAAGEPILLADGPSRLGDAATGWLQARCGRGVDVQPIGGMAALGQPVIDAALRAARSCAGVGLTVTFGAGVDPDSRLDPTDFGARMVALLADPAGWAGARGVSFVPDAAPRMRILGVSAARMATAAPYCAGQVSCRVGSDLLVDGAAWSAGGQRPGVINHLVGHWLGEVDRPCTPPGDGVMSVAGPDCVPGERPSAAEHARVAQRYSPAVTIAGAGDVHGEGPVRTQLLSGQNPLAAMAPVLSAADLAIVNLETPVGVLGAPQDKTFVFQAPVQLLDALVGAGVDVVNIANNHGLDYGVNALLETIDNARAAGLDIVGGGRNAAQAYAPALREAGGRTVAVLGLTRVHPPGWAAGPASPGVASAYNEAAAVAAVRNATQMAAVVVVAIHWGIERAVCPDLNQQRLATLLTDAGADVILGQHPHVLQGIQERTTSRSSQAVVAYSLGNFVWYHNRAPSRFTGVLTAAVGMEGATTAVFTPAEIDASGRPQPTPGDQILADVAARSPGGAACSF